MKKIINGFAYNTDTAEHIGGWANGYNYGDFSFCREDLYRTKAGAFFVHGEGGALSKYATRAGDNRGAGNAIVPLTDAEAMEWVAEHLDADVYEQLFGLAPEAGSPKADAHRRNDRGGDR